MRQIDHSGHDIRPGDYVTVDMWRDPGRAKSDRVFRVIRLVGRSRTPNPCAVITPLDRPTYELTYWVGYLRHAITQPPEREPMDSNIQAAVIRTLHHKTVVITGTNLNAVEYAVDTLEYAQGLAQGLEAGGATVVMRS